MSTLKSLSIALLAGLAISASAAEQTYTPAPYDYEYLTVHPEEAKKTAENQLVLKNIFDAIYSKDWNKMQSLYAAGASYVQHSSYLNDYFVGVKELFEGLNFETMVYEQSMFIAEGPYVAAVSKLRFTPDQPELTAIDLNFIRDGKSYGHWDILSPAEINQSGRTSFDSVYTDTVSVSEKELNQNKQLVADMINNVFNRKHADQISDFFAKKYFEHGKGKDGRESVKEQLATFNDAYWDIKRIFGQNDLILAHSRVTIEGDAFSRADIYRVRDGKIVEHWESMQPVALESKNTNSEF